MAEQELEGLPEPVDPEKEASGPESVSLPPPMVYQEKPADPKPPVAMPEQKQTEQPGLPLPPEEINGIPRVPASLKEKPVAPPAFKPIKSQYPLPQPPTPMAAHKAEALTDATAAPEVKPEAKAPPPPPPAPVAETVPEPTSPVPIILTKQEQKKQDYYRAKQRRREAYQEGKEQRRAAYDQKHQPQLPEPQEPHAGGQEGGIAQGQAIGRNQGLPPLAAGGNQEVLRKLEEINTKLDRLSEKIERQQFGYGP